MGAVRRNPMHFYARTALEYGGISRFFYGRKPTYLVADPELIREMLVEKPKHFIKNKRYKEIRQAIGVGLLNSEGEEWKRQRRATQTALGRRPVADQVAPMVELIDRHLDRWDGHLDTGEEVNIETGITAMSENLIGMWVLGPAFADCGREFISFVDDMREYWPPPPRTVLAFLKPPNLFKLRKLKSALKGIDELVYSAIREQRRTSSEDFSMLSQLSQASFEDRPPFSDRELRDQLLTLFHAGFETSASVLTFFFYRLSIQPEIRSQLYAEVERVLGDRRPGAEDLNRLQYTEQCIQEALRIYPPAYNFTRIAICDTSIGGYGIPAGAMVIVAPYATHRLPEIWPNPEGYDPDRFSVERSADRHPCAFIPFGVGQRLCVGAYLAMVQAKLITARVCQRFVLDLAADYPVYGKSGTVMRPAHGVKMTISGRPNSPA
jgi:cytochrome P450